MWAAFACRIKTAQADGGPVEGKHRQGADLQLSNLLLDSTASKHKKKNRVDTKTINPIAHPSPILPTHVLHVLARLPNKFNLVTH